MGLFGSNPKTTAAKAEVSRLLKKRDQINARNKRAGIRDETPEWSRNNAALDRALRSRDLPWYRRG
jgi:hypothetical protein